MNDQAGFTLEATSIARAVDPLKRIFLQGCLGPMSAARNLKRCSRNQGVIRMNLTVL